MPLSITPRLNAKKTSCSSPAKTASWLYSPSGPFEPLMKWEMLCILFKTFPVSSQWKAAKLCLSSLSSLRPRRHFYEIWHWKVLLKFIIKLALVTSHNYEHLQENQMLLRACEIYFQKMWRRKIKHKFYAQMIFPWLYGFRDYKKKKFRQPTHSVTTLVSGWYLPPFSQVDYNNIFLTFINILYMFYSAAEFMTEREICKYSTINDNH